MRAGARSAKAALHALTVRRSSERRQVLCGTIRLLRGGDAAGVGRWRRCAGTGAAGVPAAPGVVGTAGAEPAPAPASGVPGIFPRPLSWSRMPPLAGAVVPPVPVPPGCVGAVRRGRPRARLVPAAGTVSRIDDGFSWKRASSVSASEVAKKAIAEDRRRARQHVALAAASTGSCRRRRCRARRLRSAAAARPR